MVEVIIVSPGQLQPVIRELFWEYLQWGNENLSREFGINFDIAAMLSADMDDLGKFMPPAGRLLLGFADGQPAGIACLKALMPSIGEVKRMYVRAAARRRGLGRALLERLIDEARQIGYERLRLDSAHFMREAHQLYRTMGFGDIEPYAGSEIPSDFWQHWIFMELLLGYASAIHLSD